jgi:hypothetical protein
MLLLEGWSSDASRSFLQMGQLMWLSNHLRQATQTGSSSGSGMNDSRLTCHLTGKQPHTCQSSVQNAPWCKFACKRV